MFSKLSVLLVVALAAVGRATHHNHAHFHHRRQLNDTETAGGDMVISTVYTVQEIVVTSCHPTVLDCPLSEATHAVVTTVTVPAYTTICPATMSLSPYSSPAVPLPASLSSLISTAAATAVVSTATVEPVPSGPSNVNAAVSIPLTTGSPSRPSITAPSESMTAAGDSFSTSTFVDTATLTYTLGTGSSTTILTTVVHLTSTKTIFSTLYRTSEAASSNNAAGAASSTNAAYGAASSNNAAGAASSTNAPSAPEPTTTISRTSTTTLFVTVQGPASQNAALPATTPPGNVAAAQSTGAGSCPIPVTVTITADHTVTVTASPVSSPSMVDAGVSQSAAPTFTEAPYGMGNATSTGYASTGFVTLPSGSPTGTGSPISDYRRRRR